MKKIERRICLVMCIALLAAALFGCAAPAESGRNEAKAASAQTVTTKDEPVPVKEGSCVSKEEMVYVIGDASGKTSDIIVSEHLKNAAVGNKVEDVSELSDIENVKGEETFSKGAGNTLTWQTAGSDIYYQGKSEKDLPVSVGVSYKLNGKEISPEELAGKSGDVEINVTYQNNTTASDGVYAPFAAVTAVLLDSSRFSSVEAENGKVISDGNNIIVAGFGVPGMNESLGITDEDDKLPEEIKITANVEDFQLTTVITAVTNEPFTEIEDGDLDTLNDMKGDLNKLLDASQKLVDGSSDLYDGANKLYDGAGELKNGIDELANGSGTLSAGAKTLSDKLGELNTGMKAAAEGVTTLETGTKAMKEGTQRLSEGSASVQEGAKKLQSGSKTVDGGIKQVSGGVDQAAANLEKTISANETLLKGLKQAYSADPSNATIKTAIGTLEQTISSQKKILSSLKKGGVIKDGLIGLEAGADQLSDGADSLQKGVDSLNTGAATLDTSAGQLAKGASDLKEGVTKAYSGTSQLAQAAKTLSDGADSLNSGAAKLKTGAEALKTGMADLSEGTQKLKTGMSDFYQDGIRKLYDTLSDKLLNKTGALTAMIDLAKAYGSYGGRAENMEGTTTFIYKTDSIG